MGTADELTYQDGLRAQIEAVRIKSKYRGQGIGSKVFAYAINRAKEKRCHWVQLTSDKRDPMLSGSTNRLALYLRMKE